MPTMNCPKCGFSQEKGLECRRCGVIFDRYHNSMSSPTPITYRPYSEPAVPSGPGFWFHFRRFYRVSRVVALTLLILAVGLAMRASTPPEIVTSANTTRQAQAKLEQFQRAVHQGLGGEVSMNQAELNGWLSENLALHQPDHSPALQPAKNLDAAVSLARMATAPKSDENTAATHAAAAIRDVKIELLEDSLRIYTSFDFHGLSMSLELEGQLEVRNGYIRLDITNGRLGSLPLPTSTLKSATSRLFDAPDNKEKFHLPPEVRDVRVEQGQIVVFPR